MVGAGAGFRDEMRRLTVAEAAVGAEGLSDLVLRLPPPATGVSGLVSSSDGSPVTRTNQRLREQRRHLRALGQVVRQPASGLVRRRRRMFRLRAANASLASLVQECMAVPIARYAND